MMRAATSISSPRWMLLLAMLSLATYANALNATTDSFCVAVESSVGLSATVSEQTSRIPLKSLVSSNRPKSEQIFNRMFRDALNGNAPDSGDWRPYVYELAYISGPWIVIAVILFVYMVFISSCRLCCSCCRVCSCARCEPALKKPYTKCQRVLPVVCYGIFALMALLGAIIGMVYSLGITNNVIDGVCQMDTTRVRTSQFVGGIINPIDTFPALFNRQATAIRNRVSNNGDISAGLTQLEDSLRYLRLNITEFRQTMPAWDAGTHFWNPATEQSWLPALAQSAEDSIRRNGQPITSQLSQIGTNVDELVLRVQGSIDSALNQAKSSIQSSADFIDSQWKTLTDRMIQAGRRPRDSANQGSAAAFGWVPLAIVFWIVGFIMMRSSARHGSYETGQDDDSDPYSFSGSRQIIELQGIGKCGARCVACSWCCTLLLSSLFAVLAGILVAVGAVYSDSCSVLETLPQDLEQILPVSNSSSGSISPYAIMSTCYNGGNLFTALNYTNQSLSFNQLNFDSLSQLNTTDAFSRMTELDTLVTNITAAFVPQNWIKYDSSVTWDAQSPIPSVPPASFDIENATSFSNNMLTVNVSNHINNMIETVQGNAAAILAARSALQTAVAAYETSMRSVADDVQPLVDHFSLVLSAGQCGFVGTEYKAMYKIICVDSLTSFLWLAFALVLIAISALPIAITSLFTNRRYAGHGPIPDEEMYDEDADRDLGPKHVSLEMSGAGAYEGESFN